VPKPPRAILICCEGKTEKLYFESIMQAFRVKAAQIKVLGEKGQHKALIDRTLSERQVLAQEYEIDEDEIVCWAVCDDDGMAMTFTQLNQYAESCGVKLAFSRPQFEAFLLQHFEQSREVNQDNLLANLSAYRQQYTSDGDCNYAKEDIGWIEDAIFNRPQLASIAVTNSKLRKRSTESSFLQCTCCWSS